MNSALAQLQPAPEHALVDGRPVKTMTVPQNGDCAGRRAELFHRRRERAGQGDARPVDARIRPAVAEVRIAGHKGYGTVQHLAAIAAHGPCPIHRRSFAPLKPTTQRETFLTTHKTPRRRRPRSRNRKQQTGRG